MGRPSVCVCVCVCACGDDDDYDDCDDDAAPAAAAASAAAAAAATAAADDDDNDYYDDHCRDMCKKSIADFHGILNSIKISIVSGTGAWPAMELHGMVCIQLFCMNLTCIAA